MVISRGNLARFRTRRTVTCSATRDGSFRSRRWWPAVPPRAPRRSSSARAWVKSTRKSTRSGAPSKRRRSARARTRGASPRSTRRPAARRASRPAPGQHRRARRRIPGDGSRFEGRHGQLEGRYRSTRRHVVSSSRSCSARIRATSSSQDRSARRSQGQARPDDHASSRPTPRASYFEIEGHTDNIGLDDRPTRSSVSSAPKRSSGISTSSTRFRCTR